MFTYSYCSNNPYDAKLFFNQTLLKLRMNQLFLSKPLYFTLASFLSMDCNPRSKVNTIKNKIVKFLRDKPFPIVELCPNIL